MAGNWQLATATSEEQSRTAGQEERGRVAFGGNICSRRRCGCCGFPLGSGVVASGPPVVALACGSSVAVALSAKARQIAPQIRWPACRCPRPRPTSIIYRPLLRLRCDEIRKPVAAQYDRSYSSVQPARRTRRLVSPSCCLWLRRS